MNTNDSGTGSKKSWDDWSDFEINKSIASIVIGGSNFTEGVEGCVMCYSLSGWCIANPNYCNNPADMWPIIASSKIDLTYEGGFRMEWESSHIKHLNEYDVDVVGSNYHANPLRAAAIVFLEMNGVKP